ncbi:hypothetical protein CupriaWKF_03570 [Cupriavidus sp. WKF15]|uniref:hypothetical protein n=1 Tax=Cupriavidus sp. WKF15 TaxID=3032282 RepID=UPI0023E1ADE2|nr:hypothetical protein [Cupriavidus sp. WKF15]WER46672.1 hypothetical protein CupriaWKF_03570 [Cupriavidus sp. WKF15]
MRIEDAEVVGSGGLSSQWAKQADNERISAVAALLMPLSQALDGGDPWPWARRLHDVASGQQLSDEACAAFCQQWLRTSEPTLENLYAFVYGIAEATW